MSLMEATGKAQVEGSWAPEVLTHDIAPEVPTHEIAPEVLASFSGHSSLLCAPAIQSWCFCVWDSPSSDTHELMPYKALSALTHVCLKTCRHTILTFYNEKIKTLY